MGITFKENVSDIRNSKVVDLVRELEDYSVTVDVIDPHASPEEVMHEYGIALKEAPEGVYDAVVVAVGHASFLPEFTRIVHERLAIDSLIFDIKGVLRTKIDKRHYYSL
jgi:UDP-N-acetyl-D-galactosamine dehydrogenase